VKSSIVIILHNDVFIQPLKELHGFTCFAWLKKTSEWGQCLSPDWGTGVMSDFQIGISPAVEALPLGSEGYPSILGWDGGFIQSWDDGSQIINHHPP